MVSRRQLLLYLGLIVSFPAAGYAAMSCASYAWLNAAEPDRWTAEKAGLWFGGAAALTVLFLALFVYCLVSLIRSANKAHRERGSST